MEQKTLRSTELRPRVLAIFIFAFCMSVYLLNGKTLVGGDTVPHRYLPLSLLCEGNFDFNEFPLGWMAPNGKLKQPYFLSLGRNDRLHSSFGVGPGVMATPVFAFASLFSKRFSYKRILHLGKWSASLMMSISAVLLFFAFLPFAGKLGGVLLALTWGVGTSAWSMMSQSLWQHTGAAPWLAAALLCIVVGRNRAALLPWAGLFLGLATICRPANVLIAFAFALYVLIHHRKSFWKFALLAAIPAGLLLWYNYTAFGSPFVFGQTFVGPIVAKWKTGVASNTVSVDQAFVAFFGLLVSPSRGIFIYSPVLIFGAVALVFSLRKGGERLGKWAFGAFLGLLILNSFWFDWWGGWTFGYRRLFDGIFLLVFAMALYWKRFMQIRWLRWTFTLAFAFSLWVQVVGAFSYDMVSWNGYPDIDRNPQRLWSISESQLWHYMKLPSPNKEIRVRDCPPLTVHICPVRISNPRQR